MTQPQMGVRYVDAGGMLTVEGVLMFNGMIDRLTEAEAKLAAISAVVAPVGGIVVDIEARAAIAAIIAGAA